MPADIWDMVFFIKEDHPSVGTMSMAEGCLIRCGLRVVEDILKASPRNKAKRRGAIQANDTDTRYEYLSRCYSMVHLGAASVRAVVVFTLDEQDRARLMELANTYGLANSTMTIVAMTAGVAQSTVVVPKAFRERAVSEISRFKKWLTGY